MQTIKDWAEYYREKRLWIYPCNFEEKQWLYWKNLKSEHQYNDMYNAWEWNNSIGIKLVVGKKGVRVVEVANKKLLKKALKMLELPKDYSWIVYSLSKYGIVIDTPGVSLRTKGIRNRDSKQASFLWDGYYLLPSRDVPIYFYENRFPIGHPKQLEDDRLLNCVEALINM